MKRKLTILLLTLAALLLAGCGKQALLSDLTCSPNTIAPADEGVYTHTNISFTLSEDADVWLRLVSAGGESYTLRDGIPLSGKRNTYTIEFNGVVPGGSSEEQVTAVLAQMLPAGEYTVEVFAISVTGRESTLRTNFTLNLPDDGVPLPELENLKVKPKVLTPNEDGEDDLLDVRFDLALDVEALDVYLLRSDGTASYRMFEVEGTNEPLSVGPHQFTYDIATEPGVVSRDGDYLISITTVDALDQSVRVVHPLEITQSGRPHAYIVDARVDWSTDTLGEGDTLCFDLQVVNDSETYIRTSGPEPGTTYRSDENFATLSGAEDPGAFRIAMDYDDSKTNYPYRWAVGTQGDDLIEMDGYWYLAPGETAHVHGCVTFEDALSKDQYVWMGLLHEQGRVPYINHRVAPQLITILQN